MKDFSQKISEYKQTEIQRLIDEKTEFSPRLFLLQEGYSFFTSESFDFQLFSDNLIRFLRENLKFEILILYPETDTIIVQYRATKGFISSIGLRSTFLLYLTVVPNQLIFNIKPLEWQTKKEADWKGQIGRFLNLSNREEISQFIADYLQNILFAEKNLKNGILENRYVEEMSKFEKIWFYTFCDENEMLLSFLNVSEVKNPKIENKLDWKYLLTSKTSFLVGFDENHNIEEFISLSIKPLEVKNELLHHSIKAGEIEWTSSLTNVSLFENIKLSTSYEAENRIREIARLNYLTNEKIFQQSTSAWIRLIAESKPSIFDDFILSFLPFANHFDKDKDFVKSDSNNLLKYLKEILDLPESDKWFIAWLLEWKIAILDSVALVELMFELAEESVHFERLLNIHREVRENFLSQNSDSISQVLFDIQFCHHLLLCNLRHEATSILEKRLKELPEEVLLEVIPSQDVDFTSENSGQQLKIAIIELLISAQAKEKALPNMVQLARLQPLVKNRIETLIDISEGKLRDKALIINELLELQGLQPTENSEFVLEKFNILPKELIETHLQHPASKNSSWFENLQKWLAKTETPNLETIKSYSEIVTEKNFSGLIEMTSQIQNAFQLPEVEIFVTRGEKNIGVHCFEEQPPCLFIGNDHLLPDSPNFLTPKEWLFVLGTEFSHLFFKHTRFTSSDIWKGALDKGTWLLDALLLLLPAAGLLGKAIGKISRFYLVGTILQKIGNIGSKTKDAMSFTTQVIDVYKNSAKKTSAKQEKEQELMATSRLMLLTSDRAGLVFCGDLKAAIRGIFLTSKRYSAEFSTAESQGLRTVLLKQNIDKTFIFQELAIRIASLCSFYLSEDYEILRQKLLTE